MLTREQLSLIIDAVHQQVVSAVRQQATKRAAPMIAQVYKTHETTLKTLEAHLEKLLEEMKAAEAADAKPKK